MSREIGLEKFFIISKQFESLNGRTLEKTHEDIFEAFMGALFNSVGFEPCCLLLFNLLETLIDYSEKLYKDNNYKDILLRSIIRINGSFRFITQFIVMDLHINVHILWELKIQT